MEKSSDLTMSRKGPNRKTFITALNTQPGIPVRVLATAGMSAGVAIVSGTPSRGSGDFSIAYMTDWLDRQELKPSCRRRPRLEQWFV